MTRICARMYVDSAHKHIRANLQIAFGRFNFISGCAEVYHACSWLAQLLVNVGQVHSDMQFQALTEPSQLTS